MTRSTQVSPVQMRSPHYYTLLVGFGTLMVINFGFDWWRRYDFETRVAHIDSQIKELEAIRADIKIAMIDMEGRLTAVSGIFDNVLQLAASLRRLSAIETDPEVGTTATPESSGQYAPLLFSDNNGSPHALLDTPLDVMDPVFQTITTDPYIREQYSHFYEPANWDSLKMIEHFELLYNTRLSDQERELLRLEIEAYKSAAAAADTLLNTQRNIETLNRVVDGDVDKPQLDGSFPPGSVEPVAPDDNQFAITLGTNYRIRWLKSRYPEMYRVSRISQYVVFQTLNHVRDRFTKRR